MGYLIGALAVVALLGLTRGVSEKKEETWSEYWAAFGRSDRDIETLASVLKSEVGSQTPEEKIAVGWAVRNRALHIGVPLREFLWPPGKQGTPRPDNPKKARPYSSAKRARLPKDRALYSLAEAILSGNSSKDPVDGAYDAYEPALSDKFAQQYKEGKRDKPHKTSKELADRRVGWGMVQTAKIGRWVFWKK